jgi:hypothetical protein
VAQPSRRRGARAVCQFQAIDRSGPEQQHDMGHDCYPHVRAPFASETGGEGRQNTSNLQDFALFSSDAEAEGSLAYWNS